MGRLEVVIESAGAGAGAGPGLGPGAGLPAPLIVIVNSRCALDGTHQLAEGGFSSLRLTQKDQPHTFVGVPLTWPLDASINPGGSDPPMRLY
jgi:hypothetical protein